MRKSMGIRIAAFGMAAGMTLLAACGTGETAGRAAEADTTVMAESEDASVQATADDPAETDSAAEQSAGMAQMAELNGKLTPDSPDDAYRTTYEVFVYSFFDSDGDGIGDLNGVREKLDYINDGDPETQDDLGCSEIWLMPVFPSPTYHKYDTTDYEAIDPQYGSMEDFDALLSDCHNRGIRVILDLALNHTSTEHPWFQQAAEYLKALPEGAEPSAAECPYVDYYNFTRAEQDGYEPLSGTDWYYEARFWSGMPDLNLDSDAVCGEIEEITAFWIGRGVDGFRLDALTSYYTPDQQASIDFLTWLTDTVKQENPEAYLVGECWTDQNSYAEYYQSGIDSLFDFQFAGNDGVIANVVRGSKKASSYVNGMVSEEALYASYNTDYVNAPFYTNHDMARSAGYYTKDDGSKDKLAGALNLLMTGNAFIYYGEEIGMKGSGIDENKRAPMYWSDSASAEGMCRGPPDMEDVEMKYPSVEEQEEAEDSILNYYKNAIRIRNSFPVIARGNTVAVEELCGKETGAFLRTDSAGVYDPVLILLNTSDESQEVVLSDGAPSTDGYDTLSAVLVTGEDPISLQSGILTLPPRSVAVLTQETARTE